MSSSSRATSSSSSRIRRARDFMGGSPPGGAMAVVRGRPRRPRTRTSAQGWEKGGNGRRHRRVQPGQHAGDRGRAGRELEAAASRSMSSLPWLSAAAVARAADCGVDQPAGEKEDAPQRIRRAWCHTRLDRFPTLGSSVKAVGRSGAAASRASAPSRRRSSASPVRDMRPDSLFTCVKTADEILAKAVRKAQADSARESGRFQGVLLRSIRRDRVRREEELCSGSSGSVLGWRSWPWCGSRTPSPNGSLPHSCLASSRPASRRCHPGTRRPEHSGFSPGRGQRCFGCQSSSSLASNLA